MGHLGEVETLLRCSDMQGGPAFRTYPTGEDTRIHARMPAYNAPGSPRSTIGRLPSRLFHGVALKGLWRLRGPTHASRVASLYLQACARDMCRSSPISDHKPPDRGHK